MAESDKIDEVLNKFTGLEVHIGNIKDDISEMKKDRKATSKEFWNNINNMNEKINENKTEMKILKTKVGFIAAGIGAAVTLAIHWIKKQF